MSTQASTVSCGLEGEEEDEEDSSSNIDDVLENFRDTWRREVSGDISESEKEDERETEGGEDSPILIKARQLFLRGVECEMNGDLCDSVQFYKKAFQLVPDIDYKTFDSQVKRDAHSPTPKPEVKMHIEGPVHSEDLITAFTDMTISSGKVCEPDTEQSMTHISILPYEVIVYILRWVISSDLDLASLERASSVCRGFYAACRSANIWERICLKTWGTPIKRSALFSWRNFYILTPKVLSNGCYIAKMTYMREGEKGYQNEFYMAWHVVKYYRYVRFFAGRVVVMATSADRPASVVKLLKSCNGPPLIQGMFHGRYKIVNNQVICILVRKNEAKALKARMRYQKRRDSSSYHYEAPDQEMRIEFDIIGNKNRRLEWSRYTIKYKYSNGQENIVQVDTSNRSQFPPLIFSPVLSYTNSSRAPL